MNADNFFDQFKQGGHLSYSRFETLVLRLLSKYLEEQQKPLVENERKNKVFDAVAPDGVDNLPGPTLIEIKLLGRGASATTRMLENIYSHVDKGDFRSALLVVGTQLSPAQHERIENYPRTKPMIWGQPLLLEAWDTNQLLPLLRKYAEFVADLVPQLRGAAVDNVVLKSLATDPNEWKKTREQHIEGLRKAYASNDLALFLGAGVSRDAGVPDWASLLAALFLSMVKKRLTPDSANISSDQDKEFLANKLQGLQEDSPLLIARYLRVGLGDSFEEAVSKALYERVIKHGGTSPTLKAIARLCTPRRDGPGIRAISTYNFDDLVEKHLDELDLAHRPIYRDQDVALQEELSVHHVHGFLPRDTAEYDGISDSLLVFSEERYHALLSDPFSWSNLVQLNLLRESTCLMVGLSLTDPNLRRLLSTAAQKNNVPWV